MTYQDQPHVTTAKKSDTLRIEPVQVLQTTMTVFRHEQVVPDRFRIIFCQAGHGAITINGDIYQWVAPFILCLSETAKIMPIESTSEDNTPIAILYFHPRFLHKHLDFSNIRVKGMDTEPEIIDNRLLLRPFIYENFLFLNHIAPETAMRTAELLEACQRQLTEQPSGWWPCRTRSYISELLFLISEIQETIRTDTQKIDTGAVSADFKPVLDYLMSSYHTPLTLAGIASVFATNRTTLNKRFRKETGMSAIAYLIDMRLRIAAAILSNTDLPVSEITARTGFHDTTHFERTFRQKYHMSPSAYRTAHKTGKSDSTSSAIQPAPADTNS